MGKLFETITPQLADWVRAQHMFFVATAPLAAEGLVNLSPKGLDTFRILGPRSVAYLDLTGSGIETAAHLQENGRIVMMFCAFDAAPKIVRFHGRGRYCPQGSPEYGQLRPLFGAHPGIRGIVTVDVTRISDSCGFGVPRYDYAGERDTLTRWAERKGPEGVEDYQRSKNARSIDGLPGLAEAAAASGD